MIASVGYRSVSDHSIGMQAAPIMNFAINREGWIHWPEREDLSLEFMQLLAAAQDGGSTVSECWLTASRIDLADDHSWYREWSKTAALNHERGDAALAAGQLATARSNWLRAIGYYRAAAAPFDFPFHNSRASVVAMRECAANYLRHGRPGGEVVSIPWRHDVTLQGYFLPAPSDAQRAPGAKAPAVICIGEPGHRKEEFLYKLARHASERGLSVLAVDLLGEHPDASLDTMPAGRELESAIGCFMDYLSERDDVDESRIGILADGWGSSFVARGIAFDQRFAAAVCDGGIWDAQERSFLSSRATARGAELFHGMDFTRVIRNIAGPLLITMGEKGWLPRDRARELVDQLRAERDDITLKIFDTAETAAAQGHGDNPALANEFIFDWLAARLR
jgi:dienelactone hydrolase